jgi:hypothetical protein
MKVRFYCGTIIENESPQVAPWLFEVDIKPFLKAIVILVWVLLPCLYSLVAVEIGKLGESLLLPQSAQRLNGETPLLRWSPIAYISVTPKFGVTKEPGHAIASAILGLYAPPVTFFVVKVLGRSVLGMVRRISKKLLFPLFEIGSCRSPTIYHWIVLRRGWILGWVCSLMNRFHDRQIKLTFMTWFRLLGIQWSLVFIVITRFPSLAYLFAGHPPLTVFFAFLTECITLWLVWIM